MLIPPKELPQCSRTSICAENQLAWRFDDTLKPWRGFTLRGSAQIRNTDMCCVHQSIWLRFSQYLLWCLRLRLLTSYSPSVEQACVERKFLSKADIPVKNARQSQKACDAPVVLKVFNWHPWFLGFLGRPLDLARVYASATKESGAWLHALPASSLGNLLDDDSLKVAVALHLGAPVCAQPECRCGAVVAASGHQGLCCTRSAGRLSRYNTLTEVIRRALVWCNILCVLGASKCESRSWKTTRRNASGPMESWKNRWCGM